MASDLPYWLHKNDLWHPMTIIARFDSWSFVQPPSIAETPGSPSLPWLRHKRKRRWGRGDGRIPPHLGRMLWATCYIAKWRQMYMWTYDICIYSNVLQHICVWCICVQIKTHSTNNHTNVYIYIYIHLHVGRTVCLRPCLAFQNAWI